MDLVTAYANLTQEIVNYTGMDRSMLHVHAGMAIYLLAQFSLGTRRGSMVALGVVLGAGLFNEVMNFLYNRAWLSDTGEDVGLTLFWPVLCYTVSKYRRWRWNRAAVAKYTQELLAPRPALAPARARVRVPAVQ